MEVQGFRATLTAVNIGRGGRGSRATPCDVFGVRCEGVLLPLTFKYEGTRYLPLIVLAVAHRGTQGWGVRGQLSSAAHLPPFKRPMPAGSWWYLGVGGT